MKDSTFAQEKTMENILAFHDLYRTLPNRHSYIKVSGAVTESGILSVKGPSGSGESTLLRILARLLVPEGGDVYLQGQHWRAIPPESWRRRVQYLSQKPIMMGGMVEDNFRLPFVVKNNKVQGSYTRDIAEAYMQALDLPLSLMSQKAQTLSGGEASRVALIRALLTDPEVLLLDEPTAYLDGDSRSGVIHLISGWVREKPGRAIIIVSHNEEDISNLDNLAVMEIGACQGGGAHE